MCTLARWQNHHVGRLMSKRPGLTLLKDEAWLEDDLSIPAMVPPVPAPHTKASTCPPSWAQISSPVFRWARKLARFSNWFANRAQVSADAFLRATFTKWSGCVMDTGRTRCTSAPADRPFGNFHGLFHQWCQFHLIFLRPHEHSTDEQTCNNHSMGIFPLLLFLQVPPNQAPWSSKSL